MNTAYYGSPFPRELHVSLIKASLFDDEQAKSAWHGWKSNTDFETEIDGPAFRLLPLLYFNLLRLGVEDPLMGRLKGIYRQSWSSNHLLFLKAGVIIKLFKEHKVPLLVLKGIALTVLSYRNFGVRPMSDIDLLIKKSDALRTISILRKEGFLVDSHQSVHYVLRYGNSLSMTGPLGEELDLHWNPIIESNNVAANHDWWSGAISLEVGGQSTHAMSNENMLLHTLVHGMRYNPEPPIRWIPDSDTLIRIGVDWTLLAEAAINLRVGFLVMNGLSYLQKTVGSQIPDGVITQLKDDGFSMVERLAFKYAISAKTIPPQSWSEKLVSNYFFYLRQTRFINPVVQLLGFLKYTFFSLRTKSGLVETIHKVYSQLHLLSPRG